MSLIIDKNLGILLYKEQHQIVQFWSGPVNDDLGGVRWGLHLLLLDTRKSVKIWSVTLLNTVRLQIKLITNTKAVINARKKCDLTLYILALLCLPV